MLERRIRLLTRAVIGVSGLQLALFGLVVTCHYLPTWDSVTLGSLVLFGLALLVRRWMRSAQTPKLGAPCCSLPESRSESAESQAARLGWILVVDLAMLAGIVAYLLGRAPERLHILRMIGFWMTALSGPAVLAALVWALNRRDR